MDYEEEVALSPTTYRFTVKDYHRIAEADVLPPDAEATEVVAGGLGPDALSDLVMEVAAILG